MDVAGSAVGIASLGIQVCQGLLFYYDSWKGYNADIATAYDCIDDLRKTFKLLEETLARHGLNPARSERVEQCLGSCAGGLKKLEKKLQKLQTQSTPTGLRQKTWRELQRLYYPFRESTLAKTRENVSSLREHISLAIQVLQLDVSANSRDTLAQIGVDVKDTAAGVRVLLTTQRANHFRKIVDWLSPPDPWVSHTSARRHHTPHTGLWFLQSNQYQRWRDGRSRHLWMYGKAGCGKTVLSSTVIEDVRLQCESAGNTAIAVFYFSFSDSRQQSFESLLRSLVAQLGWKEPGRSMLQREYDTPNRSLLGPTALEEILVASVLQYEEVFLALDALDECSESGSVHCNMLDGLERLSERASNLKIIATSRKLQDINDCMDSLRADVVSIDTRRVDADIARYVRNELSRDRKLSRLEGDVKALIMETFAQKADGMFRWAYCQLQELRKLKSTRPSHVKEALYNLPENLHETYERMLTGIENRSRKDALVLLRWLAYARSPLSLGELAETRIVDPVGDGSVDADDRGGLEDSLEILAGLIIIEGVSDDHDTTKDIGLDHSDSKGRDQNFTHSIQQVEKDTRVRLAHFSVKEYLESEGILRSNAKMFYLESAMEHRFLAQSCLTYLFHYSSSEAKASDQRDLTAFPLLEYTAQSWFYHSQLQGSDEVEREITLLQSDVLRHSWCLVHQPDLPVQPPFTRNSDVGTGLYYACFLGLGDVADGLLSAGADVNAAVGQYGHALQAASYTGHLQIAKMLIVEGANVNAMGGEFGSALGAAATEGYKELAEMLIAKGADVNTGGGMFDGSPLFAALSGRHEDTAEMLIDNGADVNSEMSSWHESPLLTAIDYHCSRIVEMLIALGVDCNTMWAVSRRGDEQVMQMLINAGADVNVSAQEGLFGSVLQAASFGGHEKVVKMLIDAGAHINAQGGECGSALQAASHGGHEKVVEMLIERGADVNAQGGRYGNALQAASLRGHGKVVKMLLERGANVNAQGGECGDALQAALARGHDKLVAMLIAKGARQDDYLAVS